MLINCCENRSQDDAKEYGKKFFSTHMVFQVIDIVGYFVA
jgi:hypothetical protein